MNKIFRVIWNHATQSWVAVSELTKAKGKTKSKTEKKISVFALSLMTAGATMIGGSALGAVVNDDTFFVRIGNQASVTGSETPLEGVAIGRQASARDRGVSVGRGTSSGAGSVAVGCNTNANGANAVAIGQKANASTDRSIAIGDGASIGYDATAQDGKGSGAVAIGAGSYAQGQGSLAIGLGNRAIGRNADGRNASIAIGEGNLAEKSSFAFGRHNNATGDTSTAIGINSNALGTQTVAMGTKATAIGTGAFALGSGSRAESTGAITLGENARVIGEYRTGADGKIIWESSNSSNHNRSFLGVAIGDTSRVANSTAGVVLGSRSRVIDSANGTALGTVARVNNSEKSTALGYFSNITNAPRSIAAGSGTVISDATEGTVIGARSKITAGDKGIAVGVDNTITGTRSGAVGTNNTVSGTDSYVIGNNVTLDTSGSVVLGNNSAKSSATTVTSAEVNGLTYGGFKGAPLGTGSYVSVGSSATDSRQIKYVAAGEISATSTDAINGSQLHSVLTNGKWKVGNNTGAVVNNVAFGDQVNFIGANGTTVTTTANGNVTNVTISSTQYVAGGNITLTNNPNGTVTISSTGGSSGTSPENYFHVNDGKNSSDGNANTNKGAVDAKGGATGGSALAAGIKAKATALNAVAIGSDSNATKDNALAVGTKANALGDRSSAFGVFANASGGNSLALGDSANASGTQSVAIGMRSNSSGTSTVAIGSETKALACSTVAIGDQAQATGRFANSIGHYSNATAQDALAIGRTNNATGTNSTAIGFNSNATAADTIAFGAQSNATAANALALGVKSNASVADGVALGSNALANRAAIRASSATNASSATAGTVYALSSALDTDKTAIVATATNTLGAVSVGNGTHTRQIINVAAGSNDSDAVNVAQLKAVANKIPNYVAGNNIQISEPDENGDITISATSGPSYRWNLRANGIVDNRAINNNNTIQFLNGTGTTVVGSAGNTSTLQYDINRETITVNDSTGAVTSPTSGSNIAFATAREVANAIATSGFTLDVNAFDDGRDNVEISGNTIINPGDVVKVTAAGLSTVEYMRSDDGAGFRIITNKAKIHANKNGTAGLETDEDGNTVGEGNAVTAGDVVNVINNSGWNTNASGNLAAGTSARNTLINPGEAVNFAAGEGLTVEQIRSGNNVTYRFNATTSTPNYTTLTPNANGTIGVPDNNGSHLVNATEIANAINNASHKVSTTTTDEQITVNNGTTTVKAGDELKFTAGKNLVANQNGKEIKFGLTEDITVNNVTANNIKVGPVSINNTTGINAGDKVISNVSAGVNGTDAVNVDQLKDAVGNSGWKANATGNVDGTSTLTDVKPGSEVNFAAGKNLTVNQTVVDGNHTYTYAL
ncbi:ESPR-type extended signal peptide-containing protein, partial [Rodentibacter ratti]|uniref:ESPR-type extended signal peptide-containing protein n=1 Tax=Rodentibacter ratti TaxID=1906745 RepID=UPI001C4E15F9